MRNTAAGLLHSGLNASWQGMSLIKRALAINTLICELSMQHETYNRAPKKLNHLLSSVDFFLYHIKRNNLELNKLNIDKYANQFMPRHRTFHILLVP